MRRPESLSDDLLEGIVSQLAENRGVRRAMPAWGRLHIDRQLPFLVVYRRRPGLPDPGTERLVVGVASFLQVSAEPDRRRETAKLVEAIASLMSRVFGSFLVVEVWADDSAAAAPGARTVPAFTVVRSTDDALASTADELALALGEARVAGRVPEISTVLRERVAPPRTRPLLTPTPLRKSGAHLLGLEVSRFYQTPDGDVYPDLVRQVARGVTASLGLAFYRFTHELTTSRPVSYHHLGRRGTVKAVYDIDARLASIGSAFDLLLQVTPTNLGSAWSDFRESHHQRAPDFEYPAISVEPGRLKQRLWAVVPERAEDPALIRLFRGAQFQLDRKLTMLSDIGRAEFLQESLQLYGGVEPSLLASAEEVLERTGPTPPSGGRTLDAEEFCDLATAEVLRYRADVAGFGSLPRIRPEGDGLIVSHGQLLIGGGVRIPVRRADALVQHEVGTHMLTYHNGLAQPLRLLADGLPGHEETQEGLSVLAEYLVGGLDAARLRIIAARVLAVHALIDGADFVEGFRLLAERGFSEHAAFTVVTRVYRGSGLTKDAMYLRGLESLLANVGSGGDLARLYLGKFSMRHMPIIEELIERRILIEPHVLPRYLTRDEARHRLDRVRSGITVSELLQE